MTTQPGPRTVWTVLFGKTIMTWPKIVAQQYVVLTFVWFAMSTSHTVARWLDVAVAVVTQAWVGYDATRRLRATRRALVRPPDRPAASR